MTVSPGQSLLHYRVVDKIGEGGMVTGDHEQAIDRLEELLSIPAMFSAEVLVADPTWRDLRAHPRFQTLLAKHGSSGTLEGSG